MSVLHHHHQRPQYINLLKSCRSVSPWKISSSVCSSQSRGCVGLSWQSSWQAQWQLPVAVPSTACPSSTAPLPRCCSLTKPQHPEEGKSSISFSEGRTVLRAVKPSHPSCCHRASGGWQDTGHPTPAASGSIRPQGTFLSGRCTSL